MAQMRDKRDGSIWEVDDAGNPIRQISPGTAAPAQGRVFSLPPNPKEVRQEARADEDQQLQRENAIRAERAADRADATANRQAAAAEKTANAAAKPTEFQSKSAGFLGRMMQAERDFARIPVSERGGRSIPRKLLHNIAPDVENTFLNSEDRQKADQAVENFIAASLRQESGANIVPSEFDRQYRIFFPAAGDSPGVLAQKAAARRQAIEAFKIAAGPEAERAMKSVQTETEEARGPFQQKLAAMMNDRNVPSSTIRAFLKRSNYTGPPIDKALMTRAQNPRARFDVFENKVVPAAPDKPEGFAQSVVSQALSGANEGLADVLGAPADLATGAINLATGGVNALANTSIPRIEKPFLGSEQLQDVMQRVGAITPAGSHPFVRRVGRSVGAAAVPLGGAASTLPRYGAQLFMGAGGGVGGATAQQAFPGNPLAEMAGEVLGGGATAGGLTRAVQRNARKGIEAAVPTIPQLKEQAGQLYRAAESRGVVADPTMTQQLADDFRGALAAEGRISPTGRVSEVYPKAREAVQLIDDYAGHTMNPTQIQNVRGVVGDALSSAEPAERRLGGILTDVMDQWANPIAPELREARNVASRYLTAEQLERARELAGARASQFTGSGFENALRTEYRGLDRGAIKGTKRFNDDVTGAIETVARGTPASNFFRGLGRLAPTGPVSGMGSVVPAMAVGSMAGPMTGGLVGGALAGAGIAGRTAATRMGINAANQAELIARNGGRLPNPILDPNFIETLRRVGLVEAAKYLPQ